MYSRVPANGGNFPWNDHHFNKAMLMRFSACGWNELHQFQTTSGSNMFHVCVCQGGSRVRNSDDTRSWCVGCTCRPNQQAQTIGGLEGLTREKRMWSRKNKSSYLSHPEVGLLFVALGTPTGAPGSTGITRLALGLRLRWGLSRQEMANFLGYQDLDRICDITSKNDITAE